MNTKINRKRTWAFLTGVLAVLLCCTSAWAAAPSITWTPSSTAFQYGTPLSSAQLNDAVSGVPGGTATFTWGSVTVTAGATIISAGSQVITLTYTASGYSDPAIINQTFIGSQKPLNADPYDAYETYGNPIPTAGWPGAVLLGVVPGDNITVVYKANSSVVAGTPVGAYPITAQIVDPNNKIGNYIVNVADGVLHMQQRPIMFVYTGPGSFTYGTPLNLSQFTGHANNHFDNGKTDATFHDNITVTFMPAAGIRTDGGELAGPGKAVVVATVGGEWNSVKGNYSYALNDPTKPVNDPVNLLPKGDPASYTVLKKDLFFGLNNKDNVPYGKLDGTGSDARPYIDPYINGLFGLDTAIHAGFNFANFINSDPGTYAWVPYAFEDIGSDRLANYNIIYNPGFITIVRGNLVLGNDLGGGVFLTPATTYGQRFGAAQKTAQITKPNANAAAPPTPAYTINNNPADGVMLTRGVFAVKASYPQSVQYNSALFTSTLIVNQAPVPLTWASQPADIKFGQKPADSFTTFAVLGAKPDPAADNYGAILYSPALDVPITGTIGANITYTAFVLENNNYLGVLVTQTPKLIKATRDRVYVNVQNITSPQTTVFLAGNVRVGGNSPGNIPVPAGTGKMKITVQETFGPNFTKKIDGRLVNIDATGAFTTSQDMSTWTAGNYSVVYNYLGATEAEDQTVTKSLTLGKVAPTWVSTPSATIEYGQDSTTLNGQIGSSSYTGIGAVSITISSVIPGNPFSKSSGPIAIDPDGTFHWIVTGLSVPNGLGQMVSAVASPYSITYTYAGNSLYSGTADQSSLLFVNKKPVTIALGDSSKVYKNAVALNPAGYTFTPAVWPNGDQAKITVVPKTDATATSPVATYPIYAQVTDAIPGVLANYQVTYNLGTLTVTKRPITVTGPTITRPKNAVTALDLTPSYSEVVDAGQLTPAIQVVPAIPIPTTPTVGQTIVLNVTGGTTSPNYTVTLNPGLLTFLKDGVTMNWPPPSPLTYGNPLTSSQLNAYATDGATHDDANLPITYTYIAGKAGPAAANDYLLAGIYTIRATCTPNPVKYPAYDPATYDVQLTVNKANLVVTLTQNNTGKKYGDAIDTSYGTLKYIGFVTINGVTETVAAITTQPTLGNYSPFAPVQGSPAGNYTIGFVGGTAANYELQKIPVTLTISRADPVITWGPAPMVYGQKVGAAQRNATASFPWTGPLTGTFTYSANLTVDNVLATVGSVPVSVSFIVTGAEAGNFNTKSMDTTLTLNQRQLMVDVRYDILHSLNKDARIYGDANPDWSAGSLPSGTVTYSAVGPDGGFYGNETAASLGFFLAARLPNGTVVSSSTPIGAYELTVRTPTGDGNYNVLNRDTSPRFIINKAPLTIPDGTKTSTYGAAPNFSTSPQAPGGIKNGDPITINWICTASATTPIGVYPNIISWELKAPANNQSLANYSYNSGQTFTLTINPATVSVVVQNADARVGKIPTTFNASFSGFVNGQTKSILTAQPIFTLSPAPGANPSIGQTFAIVANGAVAPNYTFNYTPGVLTIVDNRAPVTVPAYYTRQAGEPIKILVDKMIAKASDPDSGDVVTFVNTGYPKTLASGATVTSMAGGFWLYYSPNGYTNDDSFTYTVTDGTATSTGIVNIQVRPSDLTQESKNLVGASRDSQGNIVLQFIGLPGYTYLVQTSTTLSTPNWTNVAVPPNAADDGVLVDSTGLFSYTDTVLGGSGFYRAIIKP